jgi:hypothetical protein
MVACLTLFWHVPAVTCFRGTGHVESRRFYFWGLSE